MSYIDTINHSYVGTFAELPVYHPLENLDEEGNDEFSATPANLIIGGGSGEHPGLVIQNLDCCVFEYLEFIMEVAKKEPEDIPFYDNWIKYLSNHDINEFDIYNSYNNLKFAHWDLNSICKFSEKINTEFNKAIKYCINEEFLAKKSTEEKINIMLGEFILTHLLKQLEFLLKVILTILDLVVT